MLSQFTRFQLRIAGARCRLRPLAVLAAVIVLTPFPAAALDVVIVARHAQKETAEFWDEYDRSRPLSRKGAKCAKRLAETLSDRKIGVVYATEVGRTLATGAAVSSLSGAKLVGDDAGLAPTPEWAEDVMDEHGDADAILVVGHSNKVGELVLAFRPDMSSCLSRFGLTKAGIPESRYGDVWILEVGEDVESCGGVARESLGRADGTDCTTP